MSKPSKVEKIYAGSESFPIAATITPEGTIIAVIEDVVIQKRLSHSEIEAVRNAMGNKLTEKETD